MTPFQTSLTRLTELPKMGPKLFSETGKLSSDIKGQAEIGACLQKVSSACDKPENTTCGEASGCFQDLPLSSVVELPKDGRLEHGAESQRIERDQICEKS